MAFSTSELMKGLVAQAGTKLRQRLGAIRHPETGEFPTVLILGDSLDDLPIRVEGSPALLKVVGERLSAKDAEAVQMAAVNAQTNPRAFICWTQENRESARRMAEALMAPRH